MKFSFKFSNLLGCCYRKGNILFTPDGGHLISPVGNRISIFDLKGAKMETLPFESRINITAMTMSPSGNLLIAVNEDGDAVMINVSSRASLPLYKFHSRVHAISFSPDGRKVAVTQENNILVFHAPGQTVEFNPFVLYRTFYGAYDETTCIDWTSDSRAFVVGARDQHARVYAAQRCRNLIVYSLASHKDSVIGVFFEHNSLDVYSVSRNGQLFIFQCDTELCDLTDADQTQEDASSSSDEDIEPQSGTKKRKGNKQKKSAADDETEKKILYRRIATHNYNDGRDASRQRAYLTCVQFHTKTRLLVAGFDDGSFTIHEMPHFNLLQVFTISDTSAVSSISSIAVNNTSDWVAIASSDMGQLCVWEWQSQSHILKQQSHFTTMSSLAYSPDDLYIATGGHDAKVKVWKTSDGFCFVTFTQHSAAVTGVTFTQNGKVVLTSSLDGTVRAFDLNKYRNFRTLTSPEGRSPCQYSCLAVDSSGEVVVAGTLDSYEIYVWSLQTGRLLEILTGHEGPVSSVTFSAAHTTLASGSWDHSVRLWDVFSSKGPRSLKPFSSDVLSVAYSPDGKSLAVATLNGHISIMDVQSEDITGTIEGRHDLGYTRREGDKITAKKSADSKSFRTLCYTADGQHLLAAGHSKNICIYMVEHQVLCKKFEVTCNLSFDGTMEFLDRRKMTEWGSLSLIDEGQGNDVSGKSVSLPGVSTGDKSSRHWKPEVRVSCVQFSPTGRSFAATTTEGLLIYSLDQSVTFDPFQLDIDVTIDHVQQALTDHQYLTAVMLAFRLNEKPIICQAVERVPPDQIEYISRALPDVYVDKLLSFVASRLDESAEKGFYATWNQLLLQSHGTRLKQRALSALPAVNQIQKSMDTVHQLNKLCMENVYTLRYQQTLAALHRGSSSTAVETVAATMETSAVFDSSSEDEEVILHSD